MKQRTVTTQQLKEALIDRVGLKFPIKVLLRDEKEILCYVRGFADPQRNVLLISENAYTLAMKILEVKDIQVVEYGTENSDGEWTVLRRARRSVSLG